MLGYGDKNNVARVGILYKLCTINIQNKPNYKIPVSSVHIRNKNPECSIPDRGMNYSKTKIGREKIGIYILKHTHDP